MSTVVPTDNHTMNKILSFAQNVNQHMDGEMSLSPNRKGMSQSNAQLRTISGPTRAESLAYRRSNNDS